MTPDDYRRRYFELKEQAKSAHRPTARHVASLPALPDVLLAVEETVPPGWYWTRRIAKGQALRLVNSAATPGISVLLWNALDTSERFNAGDSVKVQWTARLGKGRLLLSDMGRALASITVDTCGFHDCVTGGSSRVSDDTKFGADPTRRNSQENFLLAAGKHGLTQRDIGPAITFFAPVVTDEAGQFHWTDGVLAPNQYVDLRMEMDVIVAVSNCPHPLAPGKAWAPQPIGLQVWNAPPAEPEDFCRTATQEAQRAFQNNEAFAAEIAQ